VVAELASEVFSLTVETHKCGRGGRRVARMAKRNWFPEAAPTGEFSDEALSSGSGNSDGSAGRTPPAGERVASDSAQTSRDLFCKPEHYWNYLFTLLSIDTSWSQFPP
jgi:hypothetical protein